MPKSPICATVVVLMIETPRSVRQDGPWEFSVFHCDACALDFFTEDHVPLIGVVMPEDRKSFDPVYCLAKEAEFRQRSTGTELTAEGRSRFLNMARTWADLAKESENAQV